jgi:23S rRNA (guanine745-N1)-methyltransferase
MSHPVQARSTPSLRGGSAATPVAGPSALDLVLPMLRCPVCGARLLRVTAALRCPARHSFDIARQGYVSLLTGARPTSGDDAPMVRARCRFLKAGSYAPVRAVTTELAGRTARPPSTVVDVGCGTGYYLAGVLDAMPAARGLALDSSVSALRAAARAHPRAGAAACDVFRPLPLGPKSVDLVLNVFAPRNPAEFHRILHPDGRLIVTRPGAEHLAQLNHHVERMLSIDPAKEQRLHRALDPYFEAVHTERVDYTTHLTPREAVDLVLMTPSARHLTIDDLDHNKPGALPAEVTVSVLATAYRTRSEHSDGRATLRD